MHVWSGAFLLTAHGVPTTLVEQVHALGERFFGAPPHPPPSPRFWNGVSPQRTCTRVRHVRLFLLLTVLVNHGP